MEWRASVRVRACVRACARVRACVLWFGVCVWGGQIRKEREHGVGSGRHRVEGRAESRSRGPKTLLEPVAAYCGLLRSIAAY